MQQVPGSPEYDLTVATKGDPATAAGLPAHRPGHRAGLRRRRRRAAPLDPATSRSAPTGKVLRAPTAYTVLNLGQASAAQRGDHRRWPCRPPAARSSASGLTRAVRGQGRAGRTTPAATASRTARPARPGRPTTRPAHFVDADGERLAQGWKVDVGFDNFARVLTDPTISGHFLGTLVWNFAFAIGSVAGTFALGMAVALALHSPADARHQRSTGSLLILPYAMPSFAMLLVWRDMFNRDFGLINQLFGLDVDWFGQPWHGPARGHPGQLWLGFPYMFLVATGALQAIPRELTEAASIDGATPWQALPPGHPAAAAGRADAAADLVVRVQLQQLQRDLPDHRGRAVPGRQPARWAPPTC